MKVAAYQMKVGADMEANFRRIRKAIERAAEEGAQLLALPECAVPGYPPHHWKRRDEVDTARTAELNAETAQLAGENSIHVVLGTILMSSEGLLNSALVISNEGEILGRYDKLHLMDDDKRFFVGGVGARTFEVGGLTMGVLICYDARFPEPFRYLRECGAQMIVIISNACGADTWKVPVLEGTYRARAAENTCFVVAVNAAGPLQMATSRIVDPLGLDLASANYDHEEMLFAEIDLSETEQGCFYDRRSDQFELRAKFDCGLRSEE